MAQCVTHPFQLGLDDSLMTERFHSVEDDDDARTRACYSNHLPPTPLAVLRSLDDAGQVKKLDFGTSPAARDDTRVV